MDRNLMLAIVLSAAILLGWELTFGASQREALEAARKAREIELAQQTGQSVNPATGQVTDPATGLGGALVTPQTFTSLEQALTGGPGRVEIDTPALRGSINLIGGRFDDLALKKYNETLDKDSKNIQLLQPNKVKFAQFVEQGWLLAGVQTSNKAWILTNGSRLTPQSPVTLTLEEGGVVFTKTISVDENYMFSIDQKVSNQNTQAVDVTPYGKVIQRGIPLNKKGSPILHEGAVGVVAGKAYDRKYPKLADGKTVDQSGVGGWVGMTNKYWLAAAIPPQDREFAITYRNIGTEADPVFRAAYTLPVMTIAAGESQTLKSHVFGGAKVVDILKSYQKPVADGGLGVVAFDKAIDWGRLNFLTRPIFFVLNFFGDLTGNFGIAIIILTLIIKAFLFPLANKGYESMTRMKKLQPKLEKLRERHGEDKMKMQQEMMELYKKEKVNPMAGCLPILVQMPIFFALYKTLFVTIELRHEPFIGWIRDLSAPDPTNIFNLFGLIPFDPTTIPLLGAFLGVGILPLIMGAGMWFQMSLNPPPPDPTQRQIMAMLPIIFTFLFAGFAAGLVIYWIWNTVLSVLQQMLIMKKNGVDIEWKERFKIFFPKEKTPDPKSSN